MDYLFGTPYEIEQGKDMYHFSSDSELLGRFIHVNPDDHVLDVGTNNGVLLLYSAIQKPELLCGIDLFPEVIDLARKNLEHNGIKGDLHVCSLQEFHHEPFDRIICNPPFFKNSNDRLKKENRLIRAARHDDYLPLEELFIHAKRLLKDQGTLSMILPYERCNKALDHARRNGLCLMRIAPVYQNKKGVIKRILMEVTNGTCKDLIFERPRYLDELHNS